MPIIVDGSIAAKHRHAIDVEGVTGKAGATDSYYATHYMGAPPASAPAAMRAGHIDRSQPQAYLVEQPPRATVTAHFHDTDQFQVVVEGTATIGKKPVRALSLHYAGGHTPYGPIVTDIEGVHYFTLRARWDSGAKPMPGSRGLLKPVPRCHRLAASIATTGSRTPERVARRDVLPTEADGLGAALYEIGPGGQATIDLPVSGGGQYLLVVDGEAIHDGIRLPRHSCLFRHAEEPAVSLSADAGGAAVLIMQFPRPAQ